MGFDGKGYKHLVSLEVFEVDLMNCPPVHARPMRGQSSLISTYFLEARGSDFERNIIGGG